MTASWVEDAGVVTDDSSQLGGRFGASVALAGGYMAVGAPGRLVGVDAAAGSVSIFRWDSGTNGWEWVTRLTRPGGSQPDAAFGESVALSHEPGLGWTLAVGNPRATTFTDSFLDLEVAGEVHLFESADGITWTPERVYSGVFELIPSFGGSGFGSAVDLDGPTLVVGAPNGDDSAQNALDPGFGATYVYEREEGAWPQSSNVFDPPPASSFTSRGTFTGDRLGASVDVHGDQIATGAPEALRCCGDELAGCPKAPYGAVKILTRISGNWAETAEVKADIPLPDGTPISCQVNSEFGAAVSIRGDRLAVGAPATLLSDSTFSFVARFEKASDGSWYPASRISPADPALPPGFGSSVSLLTRVAGGPSSTLSGWSLDRPASGLDDAGSVNEWIDSPGVSFDCDGDGISDACEIFFDPLALDCNGNFRLDSCDVVDGTSTDCNENGIPDECEFDGSSFTDCNGNGIFDACDIAGGLLDDCNGNYIADDCEIRSAEIVWLIDTSGSQEQKYGAMNALMNAIESELRSPADPADAVSLSSRRYLLNSPGQGGFPGGFDGVLWDIFPPDPLGLGFPLTTPDLQEAWSLAAATIASDFPWQTTLRIVVPLSDECGWNMSPECESDDEAAILAAVASLQCLDVIAFPIQFQDDPPAGFRADVAQQMRTLAGEFRDSPPPADPLLGSGGRAFSRIDGDPFVIAEFAAEVRRSLPIHDNDGNGILDVCEFDAHPAPQDCNMNDIADAFEIRPDIGMSLPSVAIPTLPVECDVACLGDVDGDRRVTFDDLLVVLSTWGPCSPPDPCPADFDSNGTVDFQDLLQVLASWDWCYDPPACDPDSRPGLSPPGSIMDCIQKYGTDPVKLQACIEAMILANTP